MYVILPSEKHHPSQNQASHAVRTPADDPPSSSIPCKAVVADSYIERVTLDATLLRCDPLGAATLKPRDQLRLGVVIHE
jgi:hypothetical protein